MGVAFHLPVLEEHMLIYLCWKSIYAHLPVLEEHMLIYLCWKSMCSFTCAGRAYVRLTALSDAVAEVGIRGL